MRHKIPWWKKALSYIHEFELTGTTSAYSEFLSVTLNRGRIQLSAPDAIYSFDDLYDNFRDTFNEIDWQNFTPREILVPGLGLGSVIMLIDGHLTKPAKITAIEIDPEVIHLYHKYYPEYKMITYEEIREGDAYDIIKTTQEKYDLIVFDVFRNDIIPAKFLTAEVLNAMKELLTPSGLLVMNHLSTLPEDHKKAIKYYRKTFRIHFPNAEMIETRNNIVMLNEKRYLK